MVLTDRAFFAQHPDTNYRIRAAENQAEVDELARALLPPDAEFETGFGPDDDWRVLVVKLPLRRVARILTLAKADADGDLHALPIALGHRLAVD